jgi:hypothetical protein
MLDMLTGSLVAKDAEISGKINATSGEIDNVTATNLKVKDGSFSGTINATSGTIQDVTATNLKVESGKFSGNINIGNSATVLNQDGTGHIAYGNIRWNDEYDVHFKGVNIDTLMNYSCHYCSGTAAQPIERAATVATLGLGVAAGEVIALPSNPNQCRPYIIINGSNQKKTLSGNGRDIWCKDTLYNDLVIDGYEVIMFLAIGNRWQVINRFG